MVISLVDVLDVMDCGPTAIATLEQIQLLYMESVRDSLHMSLALMDAKAQDEIIAVFNKLGESQRARVLLSADLGSALLSFQNSVRKHGDMMANVASNQLRNLILHEYAITELEDGRPIDHLEMGECLSIWSPLGDRVARNVNGSWQVARSMTIGGGHIVIDFDSPASTAFVPTSAVLSNHGLIMDQFEREALRDKLDEALGIIDDLEPVYGLLIRNFTRRIIVRKSVMSWSEAGDHSFASEHAGTHPGSIRLLNFHLEEKTSAAATESLLHESLHVMLAGYEQFSGDFTSRRAAVRPVSPWSGNLIPDSSLSHAIFIYYACHHLFTRGTAARSPLQSSTMAHMKKRLQHFAAGFLTDQPSSEQFADKASLRPDLPHVLNAMQQRVRSIYSNPRCAVA